MEFHGVAQPGGCCKVRGMSIPSAVERRLTLQSTPEQVWRELTDPAALADWLGATGMEMVDGRQTRIVVDGVPHESLVEVVAEGRRLAWRWWPTAPEVASQGASSVDIQIEARGDATELHLIETPASRPVGFRYPAADAR